MNPSADNHYSEHRSLSSTTTPYPAQYTQYQTMQHVSQPQYATASYSGQAYQGQQAAYAAQQQQQQNMAQMPAAYAMQPSASYPGATAHPSLQMSYVDGRAMSAPGGQQNYAGHTQGYAAQVAANPQYLQQQQQQQQMYSPAQYGQTHPSASHHRYQPTPAQTLQQQNARASATYSRSVPPPPSPSGERYPCDRCEKTFSRAHDRKRHYESQHSPQPISHRCPFCRKEFSRSDSMKRHVDNGCEKDPSYAS